MGVNVTAVPAEAVPGDARHAQGGGEAISIPGVCGSTAFRSGVDAGRHRGARAAAVRGAVAAALLCAALAPARAAAQGAWTLPDADGLIERVFARIVAQDKPGALPIPDYADRRVGRQETVEAVRRYLRRPVELAPRAFSAVATWPDARRADVPICPPGTPDCPVTTSTVWLAVTAVERGDLPHEIHVWYTTAFASSALGAPEASSYEFCERWLRVGGTWRYDGFVRVRRGS